jgi:hypothetical protein
MAELWRLATYLSSHCTGKQRPSFEKWWTSEWICAQSSDLQCVNGLGRDKGKGKLTPLVMNHSTEACRRCEYKEPNSFPRRAMVNPALLSSLLRGSDVRRLGMQKRIFGLWWFRTLTELSLLFPSQTKINNVYLSNIPAIATENLLVLLLFSLFTTCFGPYGPSSG